jgi:CDP-diacylglycerol---glycerol-3-phosphate 3-phosphatidyltransferase
MVKKIPNILSASRIIMAPIFVVMYVQEEEFWSALSIAVFAIAAVTDFFDGYIARNYGAKSVTGNFLDPLADKFLTTAGFFCLWYIRPDQFPMWAIILIIIRDIGTTLIRLNGDGKPTLNVATSNLAKWKTAIQMIYLYTALIVGAFASSTIRLGDTARWLLDTGIFYWGLLLVTALTVYTGVEYVAGMKKEERRKKKEEG